MVKIIKDGTTLGYTASPTYVELLQNGSFGLTDEKHATGIVHENTVYGLADREAPEGKETVRLIEVDAGAVLNEQAAEAAARIGEIETALCELDTQLMGGL